eukprot:TRINITY_DN1165_c0_g1_i4.p1 TRINITY_DN1165_c0_g1~~TRINITY_DN1165_c0_g1_i4.p1  ORF type:complete len:275 (-),score=79.31 TRINITY_DN1165_c0_g1_i4:575-1399(-)
MGNTQISPKIKSKFTEEELQDLVEKFKKACSKKDTIDLDSFTNSFLQKHPIISKRLFSAFVAVATLKKDATLDFEAFASGIALIRKGSPKEKLQLIYQLFDSRGRTFVGKEDTMELLKDPVFDPIRPTGEGSIQQMVDKVFNEADSDNDGKITAKDFFVWGEKSEECALLLDLFNDIKVGVGKFDISRPRNFVTKTHVGINPRTGAFEVKDLPDAWKQLFKQAGITKKQAEDPEVAKLILGVVAENMPSIGGGGGGDAPSEESDDKPELVSSKK